MSSKRKKARRNSKAKTDAPHAAASEEIIIDGAASVTETENENEDEIIVMEDPHATPAEEKIESETEAIVEAEDEKDEIKSEGSEAEAAVENEVGAEFAEASKNGENDSAATAADGKKKQSTAAVVLKWVQNVMIVICAAVFLVCLYLLGQNLYEKYKGNKIYENLFKPIIPGEDDPLDINPQYMVRPGEEHALATMYNRLIGVGESEDNSVPAEVIAQLEMMRRSLSELIAANDDVCGWIYAPGTKINYPIARGNDNEYYLSHDYTKQYLAVGTPFVDCENDKDLSKNLNTVIYGHNVYNGAMFHDIEKFKSGDFFNSAKVYIYTMDGIYVYTPCSIYNTKDYYQYFRVQFAGDDDFIAFTKEMISNSMIKSSISFTPGDQMLTLSTCTNNIEGDGRYALHLKMTEFITDKTEDTADTGAE